MKTSRLTEELFRIRELYPSTLHSYIDNNFARFIFQAEVALSLTQPGDILLDVGAGYSPFAPLCSSMGLRTYIIDDFCDPMHKEDGALEVLERLGVNVLSGNIFTYPWPFTASELGIITSFDSLEHWHQSPKTLLHTLAAFLRPGGSLWIGVPNCVNLRKRMTVPFGFGKWSSMSDWYESPEFRGHVREPDVDDLKYIARDIGCASPKIIGKNWLGYRSPNRLIQGLTPFVDRLLQLNPALCSDIYVTITKSKLAMSQ